MTAVNRTTLYSYFVTGAKPTAQNFIDLIDSNLNLTQASAQTISSDISALGNIDVAGNMSVNGILTLANITTGNIGANAITANTGTFNGIVSAASINCLGTVNTSALNVSSSAVFTGQAVFSSAKGITPTLGSTSTDLATTAFCNPDSNLVANGSRKNPDGSIEKWGSSGSITTVTTAAVVYATAFPTACWSVIITARNGSGVAQSHDYVASAGLANFDLFNAAGGSSNFYYTARGI